jgi:enoyl-[acyl-carrier protein] reductase I
VRELAAEIGQYGIRVNAISAGPVRTLSAQALPMFQEILDKYPSIAPLRTNIDSQDVAGLSVFLCSDFSRHITGQVMFVDAGYSALGAYLS